jgi:formylglycine-generating enzyme required for sulfatase activity
MKKTRRKKPAIGVVHQLILEQNVGRDVRIQRGSQVPKPATLLKPYLEAVVRDCTPLKTNAVSQSAIRANRDPLRLASVFVTLNLDWRIPADSTLESFLRQEQKARTGKRPRVPTEIGDALLEPAERMAERAVRLVSVMEALANFPRLALLGAPGSGKSTVGYYLALALAEARLGQKGWRKRVDWKADALVPIRIVLREFATTLPALPASGRAEHLWKFIREELAKPWNLSAKTSDALQQVIQKEGAFFLLDGLDEIKDSAARARVAEAVSDFVEHAPPKSRFLLTSRPYAWEGMELIANPSAETGPAGSSPALLARPDERAAFAALLAAFPRRERLADFEERQIRVFIIRWYRALRALGWKNPQEARDKTRDLQAAVRREDLQPLARKPLLLTLMADLHSNRTRLPDDRTDLYNEVVELLLQRWNESTGADRGLLDALQRPGLTLAHIRGVLERLAFELHGSPAGKQGAAYISQGTLVANLKPLLGGDATKAELVVEYVEKRAGLLLGHGEKLGEPQFAFPHQTFQEFLAGCHLAYRADFEKQVVALADDDPRHWTEVLKFAARRATALRGAPAADGLVCRREPSVRLKTHVPTERDWRKAILAAEQLLEIGVDSVDCDEGTREVRQRISRWLAALLETSNLPPRDRAEAGDLLARLGDQRPGVQLKDGLLDPEDFIELPPGKCILGESTLGETAKEAVVEGPYCISRYPVTVAQYEPFKAEGYDEKHPKAPKWWGEDGWRWKVDNKIVGPVDHEPVFQTLNHPRVGVSWYEAMAFCRWLTEQLQTKAQLAKDQKITLPTEAQWEWAARWNKKIRKADDWRYACGGPEGNDFSQRNTAQTIGHTSAVGLFPKGKADCGAMDLFGNVWEWCENWTDEKTKQYRVLRGSSWGNGAPANLSWSFRGYWTSDLRNRDCGFRCVVVLGDSAPM